MTAPRNAAELARRVDALSGGRLAYDVDWREVATYPPTNDDGREVRVEVARWPARFYRIRSGDLSFTTGSSGEHIAHTLASAIADGMLGIEMSR